MNCVVRAWGAHEAELRGFLTRRLNDSLVAEDVLQDTFLRAIAEGAKFCTLDNPRAWLFRVTRNLLIDHLRRSGKDRLHESVEDNLPENIEPLPVIDRLDACLPKALKQLDDTDRQVIEYCDLQGHTQSEYAETKGISTAGAKSRIQRARQRLKTSLHDLCQVSVDENGNVCCFSNQC